MGVLDLQWWQAGLAVLTFAGLSAAPWIVALLRGGLMQRAVVTTLLQTKDDQIAGLRSELERAETRRAEDVSRALAERDHERDSVRIERQRSDDSTKAVMQLSREYGETMIHLAQSHSPEPTT